MTIILRILLPALVSLLLPAIAAAEWKPVEQIKTYAITGRTGGELYASIGERGPEIGAGVRTIAYTNFKLTWTRRYEPRNNACVLVSAVPKLIVTYTLPKPAGPLPDATARNWETFISGVAAHERVHGDTIKDMVHKIEAATVGLSVPDDPNCSKIRVEMTKRLQALSQAQRQQGRDFDRTEMSDGGNIHRLVLQLVNGP